MAEIVRVSGKDEHTLAKYFEQHRQDIRLKIQKEHPELAKRFDDRRHVLDTHLKDHHPEVYEKIMKLRKTTNTQDMQNISNETEHSVKKDNSDIYTK